jgi:hypothetical protein
LFFELTRCAAVGSLFRSQSAYANFDGMGAWWPASHDCRFFERNPVPLSDEVQSEKEERFYEVCPQSLLPGSGTLAGAKLEFGG